MSTLEVSLSEPLKAFVEEQTAIGGYRTADEYICTLVERERDKKRLRALILEGAMSLGTEAADETYFDELRDRVRRGSVD